MVLHVSQPIKSVIQQQLKIYANSRTQLNKLLDLTKEFSVSINMEFGLDKCKLVDLFKGASALVV